MKKDKEIEDLLLNDNKFGEFIAQKVENDFLSILKDSENNQEIPKYETDILKVPKDKLFSKNATYLLINKACKTKSFVNGMQAEGFLGCENTLREKFMTGETNYFVCGDYYLKFESYKYA